MLRRRVPFPFPLAALAICAVALPAGPARAGTTIRVDKNSSVPIDAGPNADIRVLPHVNLNSLTDAITATGKGNVIDVGPHAQVHGHLNGIVVDQANRITIRGTASGMESGIRVDGYKDMTTHIDVTRTGLVRGGSPDGAIDLNNDALANITNRGTILGTGSGTGIGDLRGTLRNYGRILGGYSGVTTAADGAPDGKATIYNYNLIQGGQHPNAVGSAISMYGQTWSLNLYNGPHGWLRSNGGPAIEIGPNDTTHPQFHFRNWGLVSSDKSAALSAFSLDVPLDIHNYGIMRGGYDQGERQPALELDGGTTYLGGTGLFAGGVRKEPFSTHFTRVVLDGYNVPLEVRQKWNKKSVYLRPDQTFSLGPRLSMTGVDQVYAKDLYSFQDYAQNGLKDAADALDNAVIPRTGMDQEFIGLLGMKRDHPGAVNRTLETFTGRSVQQAASDIAYTTETLVSNKLNDYMDRRIDRNYWDTQENVQHKTPWGGFLQGVGTFGEQSATAERVHQDWTNYGGILGVDYRFNSQVLAGAFASYRTTDATVDGFGSHLYSDDVSVGAYGSVGPCGCGFVGTGGLWYTYHGYDGTRKLDLRTPGWFGKSGFDSGSKSSWMNDGGHGYDGSKSGYDMGYGGSKGGYDKGYDGSKGGYDHGGSKGGYDKGYGGGYGHGSELRSKSSWQTDGHQLTSFVRGAYDWRPPFDTKSVIEPFVTLQYSGLWINGYDEKGSKPLGLSVGDQQGNSLQTMTGVRLSRDFSIGPVRLRPEVRAEYIHEALADQRSIDTTVNSPYIRPFQVQTDVGNRDYAKMGVGVAGSMSDCGCMQLSFNYDNLFGRKGLDVHDVSMNFQILF